MLTSPQIKDTALGIDSLLSDHAALLTHGRCALLSHAAATSRSGATSAQLLGTHPEIHLRCILSPEHGYIGGAGAGETCPSVVDPVLQVPIYSLYGDHRKPTDEMLDGVDLLVIDLQDLGLRCYTYVSTLALALEAASERHLPVIVTDRPIPFDTNPDGPMLDPGTRSFVGQIDAPMLYAMTPAETARWLQATQYRELELHTISCNLNGQTLREAYRTRHPAPPPSPALATWDSTICYPATVLLEAFGHMSHGRGTPLPFQVVAADWLDGRALAEELNARALPGVCFFPHPVASSTPAAPLSGLRLHVTDSMAFRPIHTAYALMQALHATDPDTLWHSPDCRPDFFDKLAGNRSFRTAIQEGRPAEAVWQDWQAAAAPFLVQRENALLYPREATP